MGQTTKLWNRKTIKRNQEMSFITLTGLEDASEKKVAPEGEYELCIIVAKMNEKEGKHSIMTVIEVEGEPDVANVFNYIGLPGEDDDQAEFKLLLAKRFFNQFGIEMNNGVELEQFVGSRSKGRLIQEEYPEGSGLLKNTLQVNRLPMEEDE